MAPSRHNASISGSIVPAGEASQLTLEPVEVADSPDYRALSRYLAQRYSIASESAQSVVHAAYDAGEQFGLDPLLLLAVMAIESRFNPFAHSVIRGYVRQVLHKLMMFAD